jgi:hypothetical protein
VGGGENKNFVLVDADTDIVSHLRPEAVPHPGLQGPVEALDRHLHEIDLPEEAPRHRASRQAEARRD